MVMSKKGQELTLGTVILIVLGIAVLVFLIFGFSTGWGNLWDKITNFAGGKANLDTIKSGCALACTQSSVDNWCSYQRTVNFAKDVKIGTETKKSFDGNCSFFSKSQEYKTAGLNVDSCSIDCSPVKS
jgi:hypothetical protein